MSEIESPQMRLELLGHLESLSDPAYQQRVWVEGQRWGAVQHDEFDYAIHFFFDDSTLKDDPHGNIGWMLRNVAEADHVTAVIEALEAIFQKHGTRLTDAQYIALSEWPTVVDAAKAALTVIPISERVNR